MWGKGESGKVGEEDGRGEGGGGEGEVVKVGRKGRIGGENLFMF